MLELGLITAELVLALLRALSRQLYIIKLIRFLACMKSNYNTMTSTTTRQTRQIRQTRVPVHKDWVLPVPYEPWGTAKSHHGGQFQYEDDKKFVAFCVKYKRLPKSGNPGEENLYKKWRLRWRGYEHAYQRTGDQQYIDKFIRLEEWIVGELNIVTKKEYADFIGVKAVNRRKKMVKYVHEEESVECDIVTVTGGLKKKQKAKLLSSKERNDIKQEIEKEERTQHTLIRFIKNTGIGAASIPFEGKYITFSDEDEEDDEDEVDITKSNKRHWVNLREKINIQAVMSIHHPLWTEIDDFVEYLLCMRARQARGLLKKEMEKITIMKKYNTLLKEKNVWLKKKAKKKRRHTAIV